jgi:SAM-dependent methyltransferase
MIYDLVEPQVMRLVNQTYGEIPQQYRRQIRMLEMGKPNGLGGLGFDVLVDGPKAHLSYPDQYFDTIVDILHICRNVNHFDIYNETYRLLKKGGRLLSCVPQFSCWDEPFEDIDTIQFFTDEALRRCLNGRFKYKIIALEHTPDITKGNTLRFWLVDAMRIT